MLHILNYGGGSKDGRKQEIWSILPVSMRECFHRSGLKIDRLQEIRIRVGKTVVVVEHDEEFFLGTDGRLMQSNEGTCFIASREHVKECMEYISRYSLYAFEEEMKQGFITIQGGHRIGIAGKVIVRESRIHNMRHVSFVNIRISHEIPGCADLIMPYIICGRQVLSTLIISPPRCGKTTLLRDVIRQISNGCGMISGRNVGVVDERSELGACYLGIPQNDLGIRTDVLDCCPKAEGMMMLIRSMAPSVIAVDEIGSKEELEAMDYAMNCGCVLIATAHGQDMDDIRQKPVLGQLVRKHFFRRYIILGRGGKAGCLSQVFDERGSLLYDQG